MALNRLSTTTVIFVLLLAPRHIFYYFCTFSYLNILTQTDSTADCHSLGVRDAQSAGGITS